MLIYLTYTHHHYITYIGVDLCAKPFAIGMRLQISQKYINQLQYGNENIYRDLGPAEFTLKYFDKESARSVYTFCMCPGGVVVNASNGNQEVCAGCNNHFPYFTTATLTLLHTTTYST